MQRRHIPELMDEVQPDPAIQAHQLRNLEAMNALLGGYPPIRMRLREILRDLPPGQPVTILDAATGGGDIPRRIVDWCRRWGRPVRILAVDRQPQTVEIARGWSSAYPEIEYLQADIMCLPLPDASVDIALNNLVLHHFDEAEAVAVLRELNRVARRAVLIQDVRRDRLCLFWTWLFTRFTANEVTRHDGPVSVRCAFDPDELALLATLADMEPVYLRQHDFYRVTLVYRKDQG